MELMGKRTGVIAVAVAGSADVPFFLSHHYSEEKTGLYICSIRVLLRK